MGQIAVLDQNMINMIAAGEVIERPASVVKELLENSIDAGASKISVSIEDGGRKLITVTDNGCGMDGEDLCRAFEPHTTSKIKTSRDLQAISTLGFRGEALASIAAIAQLTAASRPRTDDGRWTRDEGRCIEIDCGNKGDVSPCSTDYGTTIHVRDIFYKLPARRKFLKTANTETGHIIEHFTRIALAHCKLDMTLTANGREVYRLLGKQGLRQRIAELFTSEIAENLIETESDEKKLQIFALMGGPGISRTNSKFQYVFLNGRFVRDKFISHAIKEAYRGSLEPNRFGVAFLFIQMPYEDYDVNVHPTKIEVRFYNANLIHSQILACLREKLLAAQAGVDARLPSAADSSKSYHQEKIADAMAEFFKKHRPAQAQQHLGFRSTYGPKRTTGYARHHGRQTNQIPDSSAGVEMQRKFLQIHDSFIVAATETGFVIIDQHALHERIIYEDLCRRIRESSLQSQKLLVPESVEVTDSQISAHKSNSQIFKKLGIELEPFGPKTMVIQAFPTLLANVAPADFVQDLLDLLVDAAGQDGDAQRLLDDVLSMAACKAAIKAGQKLNDAEIEQLLADKENIEQWGRCPHGRPTTINFSAAELEKQFKRT